MVTATSPGKRVDYILEEDRDKPEGDRSVFHLRVLRRKQKVRVMSLVGQILAEGIDPSALEKTGDEEADKLAAGIEMLKNPEIVEKIEACLTEIARVGIAGWDNVPDGDGGFVEAKVSGDLLSEECVEWLSMDQLQELMQAVQTTNKLSEDERGNSR